MCSELTRSLNYILKHLNKLSRLNLGGSRLTGQIGDMFLGIQNKFRYLGLSGCFLGDKDLRSISNYSCFHDITELNICYNVLHGKQDELKQVFSKLTNLNILEMECNHLRGEEISQIFSHLSNTLSQLVCLNISCEFTRNVVWTFSNVAFDVLPKIMLMSSVRYLKLPHIIGRRNTLGISQAISAICCIAGKGLMTSKPVEGDLSYYRFSLLSCAW